MQKNKILAVYPNLEDHNHMREAFADSHNEIICVTCIVDAVRLLMEHTYSIVFVDSKMIVGDEDCITTTLKTITTVPIIVVNTVVYKKTPTATEPHRQNNSFHEHQHTPMYLENHVAELHYQHILTFGKELIIDPNRREVLLSGSDLHLTKIEFDMLYFLACHKGRVMSRKQIYENVWTHDTSFDVDELVKAHIKRLRKKLAQSEHDYIQNVRGIGYKFCG